MLCFNLDYGRENTTLHRLVRLASKVMKFFVLFSCSIPIPTASSMTVHGEVSMRGKIRHLAVELSLIATYRIPGELLVIFPVPMRKACSEIRDLTMNLSLPSPSRLLARLDLLPSINVTFKDMLSFSSASATKPTNYFSTVRGSGLDLKAGISCRICTGLFIK